MSNGHEHTKRKREITPKNGTCTVPVHDANRKKSKIYSSRNENATCCTWISPSLDLCISFEAQEQYIKASVHYSYLNFVCIQMKANAIVAGCAASCSLSLNTFIVSYSANL